jgi:hypothetical protein
MQKLKHIPETLLPKVRKLIDNGRRLEKLEAEYAHLMTEESLAALKKRKTKTDPAAPTPRQRHRTRRVHRAGRSEGKARGAAALRRRPLKSCIERYVDLHRRGHVIHLLQVERPGRKRNAHQAGLHALWLVRGKTPLPRWKS